MKGKLLVFYLLLFSVVLTLSGCWAAMVGAGAVGYGYVRGELKADLSGGINSAYAATLEAMEELQLDVTEKSKDALSGKVTALNAEEKKVKIELERSTEEVTNITIRIGVFGNQKQSVAILEKIKANL